MRSSALNQHAKPRAVSEMEALMFSGNSGTCENGSLPLVTYPSPSPSHSRRIKLSGADVRVKSPYPFIHSLSKSLPRAWLSFLVAYRGRKYISRQNKLVVLLPRHVAFAFTFFLIYPVAPFRPSSHELNLLHNGRTPEYSNNILQVTQPCKVLGGP